MSIFKGDTCLTGEQPTKQPDWAHQVQITSAQIQNTYTIPFDGILIAQFTNNEARSPGSTLNYTIYITLQNGETTKDILYVYRLYEDGSLRPATLQIPVNAGQKLGCRVVNTVKTNLDVKFCHLIPYEE